MKKLTQRFSLLFAIVLLSICTISFASFTSTDCPQTLNNVPLFFYSNPLGSYDIFLTDTLTAIADGNADNNGDSAPYYAKTWTGSCPAGLSGSNCHEYTVYPNATDFSPTGIMEKIEQFTNGRPDRGEVRIITDSSETHYVYTTDHERTFSQVCSVPGTQSQK